MDRMHLYLQGIQPDALSSPRDVVMRTYLAKERRLETTKLMALASASLGKAQPATDFIKQHAQLMWSVDDMLIEESTESKHKEMQEYYANVVSKLQPVIHKQQVGNDTRLIVRGLEGLT